MSVFVGKSIYFENRRYNWSCADILKIADIIRVAVDIIEKSLI
ncbi:Protein of unknown function [Bacillus mobilis]|nr:Protein of unknown function [Bacillus mobilis]